MRHRVYDFLDTAPNSAFQTIYDIVSNLVGKAMPGIPKDKGYSPNYEEMVSSHIEGKDF